MEKMYDVFISHSATDKKLAVALCNFLEKKNLKCWIGPRDVQAGKDYARSIIEAIRDSSIMIVLFTGASNVSIHVRNEVERAFNLRLPIVPFRTEDIMLSESLEYFLSATHWLDAVDRKPGAYFDDLCNQCHALLSKTTMDELGYRAPIKSRGRNFKIKIIISITFLTAGLFFAAWYGFIENDNKVGQVGQSRLSLVLDTNKEKKYDTPGGKAVTAKIPVYPNTKVESKTIANLPPNIVPEKSTAETDLSLLSGTVFESTKNTDRLMFIALPGKRLSYTGTISEYTVSGTLKPSGANNFEVTEGKHKGSLVFSAGDETVNGLFYVGGAAPAYSFTLARKN